MSQANFARLIADFGHSIGIPDLAPDELGAVTLRVDGNVDFNLIVTEDGETVTAFTELGELDDDVGPEVLRGMLEANYFWKGTGGATLSLQQDTGAVLLAQRFATSTLTVDELELIMKRFLEFAENGLPGFGEDEESDGEPIPTVRV